MEVSEKIKSLIELTAELNKLDTIVYTLHSALDCISNSIVLTDVFGDILWVNNAFLAVTGYSNSEVVGQNPRILKSGVHDAAFYKRLWDTIISGDTWSGNVTNKYKDGSLHDEHMVITPVMKNGVIVNFVSVKQVF